MVFFLCSRANNHFQASNIVASSWKAHRPWALGPQGLEDRQPSWGDFLGGAWVCGPWLAPLSQLPTPPHSRSPCGGSKGSVLKTTFSDVVTRVYFLFSPPVTVRLGTLFCSLLYPHTRVVSGTSQVLNISICWMHAHFWEMGLDGGSIGINRAPAVSILFEWWTMRIYSLITLLIQK